MVGGRPLQRSRSLRAFSLTEALSERQRMDRSLTLPPNSATRSSSHMAGRARHKHSAENAPPETPPNVRANMVNTQIHDAPNSAPCKSHSVSARGANGPPVQLNNNHQNSAYHHHTSAFNSSEHVTHKVPYSAPPAHCRGTASTAVPSSAPSEHVRRKLEWGEGTPAKGSCDTLAMEDDTSSGLAAEDSGVKVILRVRPMNKRELLGGAERVVLQESKCSLSVNNEQLYTFDYILGEDSTQTQVFQGVGKAIVNTCLTGLNSSIFAYGQTGSGKTYTMMGKTTPDADTGLPSEHRGLTPRVFEHMFSRIREEEVRNSDKQLKYTCKCSFLEIYNEQITDLLEPSMRNLQIREDIRTGVYVENLSEEPVSCVDDVTRLILKGTANRKVASTAMNSESSRSHSVFTCVIQSQSKSITEGINSTRFSRLNLVDLAGSERQKLTGASGDRLKEAANINRSLTQLGIVIKLLAESAQSGKQRHIPYRDSRLTFLLQESLGGNAKMVMICALSPSNQCIHETISTIKFAQRVKFVQNKAVVNEEMSSDVNVLREQIRRLKEELTRIRHNSQLNGLDLANMITLPPGVSVGAVGLIRGGAAPALESTKDSAPVRGSTEAETEVADKDDGHHPPTNHGEETPEDMSDDDMENIWRKEGHRGYDSDTAAESNCSLHYRFVNEYASWAESRRLSIKPRGSVDASSWAATVAESSKSGPKQQDADDKSLEVIAEIRRREGAVDRSEDGGDGAGEDLAADCTPGSLSPHSDLSRESSESASGSGHHRTGSSVSEATTSYQDTLSDSSLDAGEPSPNSILSPARGPLTARQRKKAVAEFLASSRGRHNGGDELAGSEDVMRAERRASVGSGSAEPRYGGGEGEPEEYWEWAEGECLVSRVVPPELEETDAADAVDARQLRKRYAPDPDRRLSGRADIDCSPCTRYGSIAAAADACPSSSNGGATLRRPAGRWSCGGMEHESLDGQDRTDVRRLAAENRNRELVPCPEERQLVVAGDDCGGVDMADPPAYVLSRDIARAIDPLRRSSASWDKTERRLSKGNGGAEGMFLGVEGERFRKMWRSTTALEHVKGGSGALQLVAYPEDGDGMISQAESRDHTMQAIIAGALRRERAAEDVVQQMAGEIEQLNRLVRQYKHERECNQVLMQAREDKIRRLEEVCEGVISPDTFAGQEFSALVYEQKILQEKVDHNPEITRSGIEQQRLIEELRQYREFYDNGERDRLLEEMRHLRAQVLCLMEEKGGKGGPSGRSTVRSRAGAGGSMMSVSEQSSGSVHRSQIQRRRSIAGGQDLVVARAFGEDQEAEESTEPSESSRVRQELERRFADVEAELEETRMRSDELQNELEFCRQELELERERSEEAQERFDGLMEGHARLINSFSELQEDNLKLVEKQRAMKRGVEDLKKKASLMGPHSAEARWLDRYAAELAAVHIEGNSAKTEVESLRAQLQETAEAVQAAGELLSRLKEAEDQILAVQDEAAIAEQHAEELRREMEKMTRRHATEMAVMEQRLRESRFRKAGICQMCQMAERVTYSFPEADTEAMEAAGSAEDQENRAVYGCYAHR
ncbi:hypothetical protein CBR_g9025 [Chara braunii]|uniref:Kinesin motor domain-containing protein n=1 Tax=Chara braunii TaxID=69332 RepID=A0A388KNH7_CHABU|nr:hypothetical protein CBR_g9025 [Chara braunii]|eukprot:GBG71609.1 hypothetical protein CBR_g9025 [Chara braunii]